MEALQGDLHFSHGCNTNYPRPGRGKASEPVLLSDFPEGRAWHSSCSFSAIIFQLICSWPSLLLFISRATASHPNEFPLSIVSHIFSKDLKTFCFLFTLFCVGSMLFRLLPPGDLCSCKVECYSMAGRPGGVWAGVGDGFGGASGSSMSHLVTCPKSSADMETQHTLLQTVYGGFTGCYVCTQVIL